jgi:hypothetical protein
MTYSGATWRIFRLRRRLRHKGLRAGITPLLILMLLMWWIAVTIWYPFLSLARVLLWAVRYDRWKKRRAARKAERQARKATRPPAG